MNDLLTEGAASPRGPEGVDPAQQLFQEWRQGPPPSLEEFLSRTGELPARQLVAVLQVDQRERWHQGERVLVEDYLQARPALREQEEAVLDLVYSEIVVREEVGDPAPPEEYLRRFPHLAPQLRRQLALHEALEDDSLVQCDLTTLAKPRSTDPQLGPTVARPERIGKYLIVSALDEGGQGSVFRAVHPTLGKDVAVKWSRFPLSQDPVERDRLLAEGRILAELHHPNLAAVYDMDVYQDRLFVVLEYVRGRSLEQYAREETPSARQAAVLVAKVARAAGLAHRCGIVHRDIKPRNILIDEAGEPRLIDFGLARLQQAWGEDVDRPAPSAKFGHLLGTVQYMAPEQAMTLHVDVGPRSDIFALGGVLYFLLAGRAPFRAPTFQATLAKAQRGDWDQEALVAARVPRRLESICRKALAKAPADRHTRAEDLAAELEAFAQVARPVPRRVWMTRLLAGVAVLVPALIGPVGWRAGWWSAASGPESSSADRSASSGKKETGHAVQRIPLSLSIRVWRKQQHVDLVNAMPLRAGDELRIQAEVPAHWHASLFLFTSEGRLRLLRAARPTDTARTFYYPGKDQAAPLVGPPGTEMLLVCASPSGPIEEDAVRQLWTEGSWSALRPATVLHLDPDKVHFEQKDRDFGPATSRRDAEEDVRSRLEKLRLRLRERFDHFEGLVFFHR
jgi:serine/threonine protein kinase